MDEGRMMEATINGRTYAIPEIWVAGYCSGSPGGRPIATLMDAVAWWAWQEELKEQEEASSS